MLVVTSFMRLGFFVWPSSGLWNKETRRNNTHLLACVAHELQVAAGEVEVGSIHGIGRISADCWSESTLVLAILVPGYITYDEVDTEKGHSRRHGFGGGSPPLGAV